MWVSGLKTIEPERQEACMNDNITLNEAGLTCRDVWPCKNEAAVEILIKADESQLHVRYSYCMREDGILATLGRAITPLTGRQLRALHHQPPSYLRGPAV